MVKIPERSTRRQVAAENGQVGRSTQTDCIVPAQGNAALYRKHFISYQFDMPMLPPTTIDDEIVSILSKARAATKSSQAEIVRQCIRAHGPVLAARKITDPDFEKALRSLRFNKTRVREIKEARR
jgi:hypothetical protein